MWQEFSRHGIQHFTTAATARKRMRQIEKRLTELCEAIASTAARQGLGIERARSLRAKPADGGRSLYECLNQLIHYWYCCASAAYLLDLGYQNIKTRPTAEESISKDKNAFDIVGEYPNGIKVFGEVFCVSTALFPEKMKKTVAKLKKAPANSRKLVFYNQETKNPYRAKRKGVFFFGVKVPDGSVELICSTDTRTLPGVMPNLILKRLHRNRHTV